MIKFRCKSCGQKINVQDKHTGKRAKCPKCSNIVVVPKVDRPGPPATQNGSGNSENSGLKLSPLDTPKRDKVPDRPTSQDFVSHRTFVDTQKIEASSHIDETEPARERKLPWFIDMFLYPLSVSGIIHLAIFLLVPLLIGLLDRFILSYAGSYGGIVALILYILLIGYMFYYLSECIRDSAKGNWRAPDISLQPIPDKGELISQLLYLLGSAAICFWPTAVYYILTEQTDLIFWLLLICGCFFFPMGVLVVFMFGSISALNPLLIIGSIVDTFLHYSGMILFFYALGGLVALIVSIVPKFGILSYIPKFLSIYLLMVAAHLLGRFYWRYQEKLNWEV